MTLLQDWTSPKTRRRARKATKQLQAHAHDYAELIGEQKGWAKYAGVAAVGFVAGAAAISSRKLAMQATTAIAGDWFKQLKLEHRQVEKLFDLVAATQAHETAKRTALFAHIQYALLKHGVQEETVIYPALRDGHHGDAPHAQSAKRLAAEHFDIKTYLHELAETPKDDPKWILTLGELQTLVAGHVREEEEDIYPPFHEKLSKAENAKLTAAMNREGVKLA